MPHAAADKQAAQRWIVVPRWEEFQHRDAARVNVPTWIKLFTRLLSDDAYLGLTGHRRAILHGLWMEYARSLRQLTDNTASLSRRLSLKVTSRDLEALNQAGFIELHASKPASTDASTSAGTEERRELQELLPRAVPVSRHDARDAADERPSDLPTIKAQIAHSLAEAKETAA